MQQPVVCFAGFQPRLGYHAVCFVFVTISFPLPVAIFYREILEQNRDTMSVNVEISLPTLCIKSKQSAFPSRLKFRTTFEVEI